MADRKNLERRHPLVICGTAMQKKQVSIYLTAEELETLKALARADNRKVANYAWKIVTDAIEAAQLEQAGKVLPFAR